MAIYQPSNVIPSSFAGINEQTVDANKEIRISWQVNGNSPMTGFRIKIYNSHKIYAYEVGWLNGIEVLIFLYCSE